MRTLFLLLLLANLAFFAWSAFIAPRESSTDTRPLRSQLEPDKIRILPPEPAPLAPAPAPKPKPAPESTAAAPPTPPGAICTEWGSFTVADAPAAAHEPCVALPPRASLTG